jgi:hypothetical protein
MRKRMLTISRILLVTLFMVCGFNANNSVEGQAGGQDPKPKLTPKERPTGKLHDLAKQNGGKFVQVFKPRKGVGNDDLEKLTKQSEIIIVGRVVEQRTQLSDDGSFITTRSQVFIQEVLKGNVSLGQVIAVSSPGGSYRFADGSLVQLHGFNYRPVSKGSAYAFFLRPDTKPGVYAITGEMEGQFELNFKERQVYPGERTPKAALNSKYTGKLTKDFLTDLHTAVRRSRGKK